MSKAHFGLIGLGVMGENLVLNAERNGFSSVVFNRTFSKTEEFLQGRGLGKNIEGAETLQEFVNKLERPRRILMMVKAGAATDAVIDNISGYLEEGDLLIDGGNSQFKDTERRVNTLESKSFGYIGMGVSGGAKGALEGPSMMPGGTKASYDAIESLLTKMAAKVEDGPCVAYVGPGGSGHFVKTVHNGIEYGIEQILAEAYDLMKRVKGMNGQEMSEVFGIWNNTDELASYLVEITEICLNTKDEITGDDVVEKILDKAGQKGTGLWTVVSALELGVSVPTIYASLNARVMSYYEDLAEMYVGTDVSPDFYGWVFPKYDHVAVGTGTMQKNQSLIKGLQEGVRNRAKKRLVNGEVIKVEAHPIPEHPRPRRVVGRMALVGDAAGYVTKSSGEGIYFAAKSGRMCAEEIVEASKNGQVIPTEKDLKNYLKKWDKKYGTTYKVLEILQNIFYRNDSAREAFVEMCDDMDVQRLTFDSYLYKRVVSMKPLQQLKITMLTLGSILRGKALAPLKYEPVDSAVRENKDVEKMLENYSIKGGIKVKSSKV